MTTMMQQQGDSIPGSNGYGLGSPGGSSGFYQQYPPPGGMPHEGGGPGTFRGGMNQPPVDGEALMMHRPMPRRHVMGAE